MGRARYQAGSCRPVVRKDGTTVYEFRWWKVEPDGKRCRASDILGTAEDLDTDAKLRKAIDKQRVIINSPELASKHGMTLESIILHYRQKELINKAASTQGTEAGYIDNWIIPRWGKKRAEDIRTMEVEEWLKGIKRMDGTRAKIRNILSAIFSHAVRWELAVRNPICGQGGSSGRRGASTGVRQSAKATRVRAIIAPEQMQQIFEELPLREQAMTILDAVTGLRASEIAGLRWSDINVAHGTLSSVRSVAVGVVREGTKSRSNTLPLARQVIHLLLLWRVASKYRKDDDWMFASTVRSGRQPVRLGTHFQRYIRPVVEKIIGKQDDMLGWHSFRSSLATLLVANGENVKVVQDQLRHHNVRVTLELYAKSVREDQKAAHERVVAQVMPQAMMAMGQA